jgi:DNA-directed RNA polymerase sigma subunit (sigma70/sigma32)
MSLVGEPDDPEYHALRAFLMELGLKYRESVIVIFRYGLAEGGRRHTQDEVGRVLKLSSQRISQLERKALGKLRAPTSREKLGPDLCERLQLQDDPSQL